MFLTFRRSIALKINLKFRHNHSFWQQNRKVADDLWNFGLVRTCNNTFATTAFTTILSFLSTIPVHLFYSLYWFILLFWDICHWPFHQSVCLSITFCPVLKGSWKTMFQKIIIDETPPTLQVPLMMMSSEVTGWSKVIVAGMLAFQASPPRSQSGRRLVGGPPEREQ